MEFPDYADAPAPLLAADGHCGLLAAWTVLRYFRKRPSAARLTKACGYTRRYGVFTIGLATALAEHGLAVQFYSQRDSRPKPIERRLYGRARRLGVAIRPATRLERLLASIDWGHGIGSLLDFALFRAWRAAQSAIPANPPWTPLP